MTSNSRVSSSGSQTKNDRIYNDIFVPKRSSLDYTNYSPLAAIKTSRKSIESTNSGINFKSDSKSNFLREYSAGKASTPQQQQKGCAFKEFK